MICALLAQKPIVTIQYLKDYAACLSSGKPVPEPSGLVCKTFTLQTFMIKNLYYITILCACSCLRRYLPHLADSQVDSSRVSFQPNAARAQLFRGKNFIFFSEKQVPIKSLFAQFLFSKINVSVYCAHVCIR